MEKSLISVFTAGLLNYNGTYMEEVLKPLVTVIIPFINEERFLSEAIESVINQTYDNWELMLIDDGSSDKSSHIAISYANKMPRKIFYTDHDNHINKGVSASRNLGIDKSSGSLIAFLDADDVWLNKKLQLQVDLMNQNPDVGMLCEASEYWYYNNSDKENKNNIKQLGVDRDKKFSPPQLADILYPLSYNQAPAPSG